MTFMTLQPLQLVFTSKNAYDIKQPKRCLELTPQDQKKMEKILAQAGIWKNAQCKIHIEAKQATIYQENRVVKVELSDKLIIDPKHYEIALALLEEPSIVNVVNSENDIWEMLCSCFKIDRSSFFELLDDLGFDTKTLDLIAEKVLPKHVELIRQMMNPYKGAKEVYTTFNSGSYALSVLRKELKHERTLAEKLSFLQALVTLGIIFNKVVLALDGQLEILPLKTLKIMQIYYSVLMLLSSIGWYLAQILWIAQLAKDTKSLISINTIKNLEKHLKLVEQDPSSQNLRKTAELCIQVALENKDVFPQSLVQSVELLQQKLNQGQLDAQSVLEFAKGLRQEVIRYDFSALDQISSNSKFQEHLQKVFSERVCHDLQLRIKAINTLQQSDQVDLKDRAIDEGAKLLSDVKKRIIKRIFFQTVALAIVLATGVASLAVTGPIGFILLAVCIALLLITSGYGIYYYRSDSSSNDWISVLRHNVLQNQLRNQGLAAALDTEVKMVEEFIQFIENHMQQKERMQEVFLSCINELKSEQKRLEVEEILVRSGGGGNYKEIKLKRSKLKTKIELFKGLFKEYKEMATKEFKELVQTGQIENLLLFQIGSMQFPANK